MLRVPNLLAQFGLDLVDIDRIVPKEYALIFVNADHHAISQRAMCSARQLVEPQVI